MEEKQAIVDALHAAGKGAAPGEGRDESVCAGGAPNTGSTGGEGVRVESATAVQLVSLLMARATNEVEQVVGSRAAAASSGGYGSHGGGQYGDGCTGGAR